MHKSGYPKHLNDSDYEENCNDITLKDILEMLLAFAIVASIAFLCGGL